MKLNSQLLIPFTKMHGLGNDFVVIDRRAGQPASDIDLSSELILHLADRRHGVGCDQVMVIEDSNRDDVVAKYRIYNPDANEVEQCGNGARCVARHLYEKDQLDNEFTLETIRTDVQVVCHDDGSVSVALGTPDFEPAVLPLKSEQRLSEYKLEAAGRDIQFGAVSIGNPHAVISVKDVETTEVGLIGEAIQQHDMFPQSANVEFVEFQARDRLRLRVYERGAGETRWLDEEVTVQMPGGEAIIRWSGEGEPIWLRGEAVTVFSGQLNL